LKNSNKQIHKYYVLLFYYLCIIILFNMATSKIYIMYQNNGEFQNEII